MITVPAYIARRFLRCLFGFFVHWYEDATRVFWARTSSVFRAIKSRFAPTYWGGGAASFILTALRALLSGLIWLIAAVISLLLYLAWVFLPVYVLYKFLDGLLL